MMVTKSMRQAVCIGLMTVSLFGGSVMAAPASSDLDAEIQVQQEKLQQLNQQKVNQRNQELENRLSDLESKLNLNRLKDNRSSYDAQGAVESLATQINDLRSDVTALSDAQASILKALDKLQKANAAMNAAPDDYAQGYHGSASSSRYLVNPGGSASSVSYTQDAINSQGNSTMLFRYAPNQLYKIYCRRGYLTDLVFKKGETIKYVGGGDTAGWAVSNTTVDGTPHLFIKPVVETSTTNLIVTTDKRSYQLILNTSDWYNPIVSWTYDAETRNANLIEEQKNERITMGKVNVTNVEDLDFNYEVSGSGNKPSMVFSDGTQTYIKFRRAAKKQLPIFIRERGHKEMQLVNYTIKDNYYIVEKVFDMAQIKDGNDTLTIKHK